MCWNFIISEQSASYKALQSLSIRYYFPPLVFFSSFILFSQKANLCNWNGIIFLQQKHAIQNKIPTTNKLPNMPAVEDESQMPKTKTKPANTEYQQQQKVSCGSTWFTARVSSFAVFSIQITLITSFLWMTLSLMRLLLLL